MRHFRDALRRAGRRVRYRALDDATTKGTLAANLVDDVATFHPERLVVVRPGSWRVLEALRGTAKRLRVPLDVREDRHFLCTLEAFNAHAEGRRHLRQEFFYRFMRRETGLLMKNAAPTGGAWNYDAQNRESFGVDGPGDVPAPVSFAPDKTTRAVLKLVAERFAAHPGRLDRFDYPVTRRRALKALRDFTARRLPRFGPCQDAMWTGESLLYHSRLSSALNLKLLRPREVLDAVVEAWRAGRAPLNSVEGFVRQVLGWREYVRGVYWREMPDYAEGNALAADRPLPWFYWTGETDMHCLRACIGQTLALGYAHHIQRLMVTGLFALLYGVRPQEVHRWYLAVYVDAVEWVELPNTLGMSQFADGGLMASKPYAATGKYIDRMSNYCAGCRYDPAQRTGDAACPVTTLYWDFLLRNERLLGGVPRMGLQLRNLARLDRSERRAIGKRAAHVVEAGGYSS
jgi:deoxyribodipyrimidine photolyase-related protein